MSLLPAKCLVPCLFLTWSTVLFTNRLLFWKIQAPQQIEVEGLNIDDKAQCLDVW